MKEIALYKDLYKKVNMLGENIFEKNWIKEISFSKLGISTGAELCEALNSTNWKPWVKIKEDEINLLVELIDVFIFSLFIEIKQEYLNRNTIYPMDIELIEEIEMFKNITPIDKVKFQEEFENIILTIQNKLDELKYQNFKKEIFTLLKDKGVKTFEELYKFTAGKIVLSTFRKQHGYNKDKNTYKKIWKMITNKKGEITKELEDNHIMFIEILPLMKIENIDEFSKKLYLKLSEYYYTNVLKKNKFIAEKIIIPF